MTKNEIEIRRDKVVKLYTEELKSINQIANELKISWETAKRDLLSRDIEIQKTRNQYSFSNKIKEGLFKKIEDSDSAYWLGFLYADGSIRANRNEIALELQERDKKTIEDFHNYCGNSNTIRKHEIVKNNKSYVSYVSSFSSAVVKENLKTLGCVPNKSLILTFPNEEQVPQEYIYDFVRGYIDGDGYLQYDSEKHRYRIIILGTKDFLFGLVKRLNLFEYCSINKDKNSQIYSLTISNKENVFNLLKKLYENSKYHLQRKFDIYENAKRVYNK
jgi:hypothetical protein